MTSPRPSYHKGLLLEQVARVPRLIQTMFWSCYFVSEGKAWKGRLEGKLGREDWKGRLEGKVGMESWKRRLKGKTGREND